MWGVMEMPCYVALALSLNLLSQVGIGELGVAVTTRASLSSTNDNTLLTKCWFKTTFKPYIAERSLFYHIGLRPANSDPPVY
jgi:hypothetical protein